MKLILRANLNNQLNYKLKELSLIVMMFFFIVASAFAEKRSSIEQYGITWTFDKEYECGQFVTGDWWVVGPVTIVSVTPEQTPGRNGSVLNPNPGAHHGYDDRSAGRVYRESLRVDYPLTLSGVNSLVSTASVTKAKDCVAGNGFDGYISRLGHCDNRSSIQTMAVLTIVDQPIPNGTFRPSFVGSDHKEFNTISQVDYNILPRLPQPSMTPTMEDLIPNMDRPLMDHFNGWTTQLCYAFDNGSGYGTSITRDMTDVAITMMLDIPEEDLQLLSNYMIQRGIDSYGAIRNGAKWPADGGHASGRKLPILIAGKLLNNTGMLNIGRDYSDGTFGEDCQTYFDDSNVPRWGIRYCQDPDRPGFTDESNNYRFCCTSVVWGGQSVVARILHLDDEWNHPAFFAYTQRWVDEGGSVRSRTPSYAAYLWDNYNENIPAEIPHNLDNPDNEAPSQPTNLAANNITGTSVQLSWTASTDNFGVTRYDIYKGNEVEQSVISGITSVNISDLECQTDYSFKVKAFDSRWNESDFSEELMVTTTDNCPPVNLALGKNTNVSAALQTEFSGNKLTDGNIEDDARWSALGFPQWAEIDLGANTDITTFELYTFQSRAYQYIIELKQESGDYFTAVDRSINTAGGNPISNTIEPTNARYVKISVLGASGYTGSWVSLNELKVFGPSDPLIKTNIPPVADAGPDLSVAVNTSVMLNGANSFDPDGNSSETSLSWIQLDGPSVTINNSDEATANFTPTLTGTYVFQVTIEDAEGAIDQDQTTITVVEEMADILDHLVARWSMEEGSGTILTESSPNNNEGTISGATYSTDVNDLSNHSLSFDGVDDQVDIGTLDLTGNELSITFWAKPLSFGVRDARILCKAIGTDEQDHYWMVSTLDGDLRVRLKTENGGTTTLIARNTPLDIGEWAHFAVVYNGNQLLVYKNGTLTDQVAKSGALSSDPLLAAAIGNHPGSISKPFDGLLDEMRIYNRALTIEEINVVKNASVAGQNLPPIADAGIEQEVTVGTLALLNGSNSSDPNGETLTYTWTQVSGPSLTITDANQATASITPSEVGVYVFELEVENKSGQTSTAQTTITVIEPVNDILDHLVARWSMEEGSGTILTDSSPNDNEGTISGATYSTDVNDLSNHSLSFDGIDDQVDIGTLDPTGNELSITFWAKPLSFGVTDARILCKATGTNEQDHYWMVSTWQGDLRVRLKTENGGTTTLIAKNTPLDLDEWAHFAVVYNGNQLLVYKNGTLTDQVAKSGALSSDPFLAAAIGNHPGSISKPFDGLLDEMRIYNRALTIEEINVVKNASVADQALPPIADAGIEQEVTVGTLTSLNGSYSSDTNGETLTYTWTQVSGPSLAIVDANQAIASITPSEVGVYVFELEVENESGQTATAKTTVTVTEPINDILDHLVARWSMEEGSGTILTDSSPNDNEGTISGATYSVDVNDLSNHSLSFDGVDDQVDIGTLDLTGNELSITFWAKPLSFGVNDARILCKATGTNEQDHYWMISTWHGDLRVRLKTENRGTTTLIAKNTPLDLGEWAHFAVVYNGNQLLVYKNGTLTDQVAKSGALSSDPLLAAAIGNHPGSISKPFDGLLDEMRIYNRALTIEEIGIIQNAGNLSARTSDSEEQSLTFENQIFKYYPNPVSNFLLIKNIDSDDELNIKLMNTSGMILYEGITINNRLNMKKYKLGKYILIVETENNQKYTGVVIKR
ncbi:LamG-like jellyroll fold domain-containing protein [Reichenbachiella versicolor]|uniref:LamG-like jellyroll fold domain-containing protein n=1 Tax=Reichenbachiella versicolor TaxID=1821036 RepID=UPI000D6E9E48|nr:LamG-like jellyroll fold domain-containing protein [Reichenbachiella versicolor]